MRVGKICKVIYGKDEAWKIAQNKLNLGPRTLIIHGNDLDSKRLSQRIWHEIQKTGVQGIFFQVNSPLTNFTHLLEAQLMFKRTAPSSIISLGPNHVTDFGKGLQTLLEIPDHQQKAQNRFRSHFSKRSLPSRIIPHIMIPKLITPHSLTSSFFCLHDEDDVLLLEPSQSPNVIIWDPSIISQGISSPSTESEAMCRSHIYCHLLDSAFHFSYLLLSLEPDNLNHRVLSGVFDQWLQNLPSVLEDPSLNALSPIEKNSPELVSTSFLLCHQAMSCAIIRNNLLSNGTLLGSARDTLQDTQDWLGPIEPLAGALGIVNPNSPPWHLPDIHTGLSLAMRHIGLNFQKKLDAKFKKMKDGDSIRSTPNLLFKVSASLAVSIADQSWRIIQNNEQIKQQHEFQNQLQQSNEFIGSLNSKMESTSELISASFQKILNSKVISPISTDGLMQSLIITEEMMLERNSGSSLKLDLLKSEFTRDLLFSFLKKV